LPSPINPLTSGGPNQVFGQGFVVQISSLSVAAQYLPVLRLELLHLLPIVAVDVVPDFRVYGRESVAVGLPRFDVGFDDGEPSTVWWSSASPGLPVTFQLA